MTTNRNIYLYCSTYMYTCSLLDQKSQITGSLAILGPRLRYSHVPFFLDWHASYLWKQHRQTTSCAQPNVPHPIRHR
jgi:hypothetical protein